MKANLRLELEIDRPSRHSDLKRTTLSRNGHLEARNRRMALEASWEGGFEAGAGNGQDVKTQRFEEDNSL